MYELMVESTFAAAHQLIGSNGPCESLHGHTWKVQVFLQGDVLDKVGMLIDFKVIKSALAEILNNYDHKLLNESLKFSPTAENISKNIFSEMKTSLKSIKKVTVWESATACSTYSEV